jgi:hypothetical protein
LPERERTVVEIVDLKTMRDLLSANIEMSGVKAVVFMTRGFLNEAKQLKKRYKGSLRVVVTTGSVPDDEPTVLNKLWIDQQLISLVVGAHKPTTETIRGR